MSKKEETKLKDINKEYQQPITKYPFSGAGHSDRIEVSDDGVVIKLTTLKEIGFYSILESINNDNIVHSFIDRHGKIIKQKLTTNQINILRRLRENDYLPNYVKNNNNNNINFECPNINYISEDARQEKPKSTNTIKLDHILKQRIYKYTNNNSIKLHVGIFDIKIGRKYWNSETHTDNDIKNRESSLRECTGFKYGIRMSAYTTGELINTNELNNNNNNFIILIMKNCLKNGELKRMKEESDILEMITDFLNKNKNTLVNNYIEKIDGLIEIMKENYEYNNNNKSEESVKFCSSSLLLSHLNNDADIKIIDFAHVDFSFSQPKTDVLIGLESLRKIFIKILF